MFQSATSIPFQSPLGQPIDASFDLGSLTSDGGLLWLQAADDALGLCHALADVVSAHGRVALHGSAGELLGDNLGNTLGWDDVAIVPLASGPGEITAPEIDSDLRVGGAYRIVMLRSDGERLPVRGVFREIREPERLSYTWTWEEDSPESEIETLVTVEFRELGQETEVVLTHEGFASEESRGNHEQGWNGALDKLAKLLA